MEAINNYLVVKKEIIEEQRSAGGIILNVSSAFDFDDEFTNKSICVCEVMYSNSMIPFAKAGERIVTNPTKGTKAAMDFKDYTVLHDNQILAKIDKDGKYVVPPASIMIKINREDRDALYSKWIVKDDGTKVQLFLQPEPEKYSSSRSQIFVSLGEVVQVGSEITEVLIGDVAILDYTVDNFTDNVLYYDDKKNKYLVIEGITTFHTGNTWAYADRNSPRDNLVSKRGDLDISSPLLGVIRNDELIARQPYVFLNHLPSITEVITNAGIKYSQKEDVLEREVLSVSAISQKKYGIIKGQTIVVQDYDIFQVKLRDSIIDAVLDQDVLFGYK